MNGTELCWRLAVKEQPYIVGFDRHVTGIGEVSIEDITRGKGERWCRI